MNGALFRGEQVVKACDLEPVDAQLVYLGKESGERKNVKAIVDKVRMWKGSLVHILIVEHQAHVDYHMVLRNMLESDWLNRLTSRQFFTSAMLLMVSSVL